MEYTHTRIGLNLSRQRPNYRMSALSNYLVVRSELIGILAPPLLLGKRSRQTIACIKSQTHLTHTTTQGNHAYTVLDEKRGGKLKLTAHIINLPFIHV